MRQALDLLASRTPAIEAIGVTDYCTTASYRQAAEAVKAGAGEGIQLIFPNVELRLSSATRREAGVNLHLLAAPDDVDGLDRFLNSVTFTFRDRRLQCERRDLQELGRMYSNDDALPDHKALQIGAQQFKVEFGQLKSALEQDSWARDHILVAVAGGGTDGTSGLQSSDNAFGGLRQSIERFAHIIFSGDPKQVEFWSGRGVLSEQQLMEMYNGKKLCLHGSDAHRPEKLGMPDLDRRCWMKGTPTFDTLRMGCLAPDTRGHVGSTDPMDGYRHGRIARVTVAGKSWFPAAGIAINPGLVAVIGARGSGKTALADLVAAGAGSQEPFSNAASFIRRAGPLLHSCTTEVQWTHGETTRCDLASRAMGDPSQPRSVRYLSQQFVEQLCAADGVSDNLLAEIERVVFASLPPGSRQGATDFSELLAIRLQAAKACQRDELEAIADLSRRISHERILSRSAQQKESELGQRRKVVERLVGQIGQLTSKANPANTERLQAVTLVLDVRYTQLQAMERRRTDLESLRSGIASARSTHFPRIQKNLREQHPHAGLTPADWEAFHPQFSGDVDSILAGALAIVEGQLGAIAGTPVAEPDNVNLDELAAEERAKQPVSILAAEQSRLQRLVGLDQRRAADLKKLNDQVAEERARLAKLEAELEHAKGAPARRESLQVERLAHYAAYFDALIQEETELKELYAPLADKLLQFGTSTAKLKLSVRRKVDVAVWAAEGERHLDLRTSGTFRGYGEMERLAIEHLLPAWQSGDGQEAADAIRRFSAAYSADLAAQSTARARGSDEYREWEISLSRWLYSAEHIKLNYTLNYGNLSIERLSPGSRGIVLLLLYLAVDRSDLDPLIIDQPEENLDPESVYSELVVLFREASRRRQIIMVTHNANLVVNTDVDQVIVARCNNFEEGKLPDLEYLSGGLEEQRVREAVCEVLEGGAEAFRQRARRLRIPL